MADFAVTAPRTGQSSVSVVSVRQVFLIRGVRLLNKCGRREEMEFLHNRGSCGSRGVGAWAAWLCPLQRTRPEEAPRAMRRRDSKIVSVPNLRRGTLAECTLVKIVHSASRPFVMK